MKRKETREFYNQLAESKRGNRGLSCGFKERYDPAGLLKRPEIMAQLRGDFVPSACRAKDPMASVLDIGAGTFFYRELLESRFERVVGLNCSLSMLGSGAESPSAKNPESRTELCCGEVKHLPFPDDSFSCVFGMDVIHHLEDPVSFQRGVPRAGPGRDLSGH